MYSYVTYSIHQEWLSIVVGLSLCMCVALYVVACVCLIEWCLNRGPYFYVTYPLLIRIWYYSFIRDISDSHSYLTWRIHTWHLSFSFVSDMTHSHVTSLILIRIWHDSFTRDLILIRIWHDAFIRDISHSHSYPTWLIHMWHDAFMKNNWVMLLQFVHMCGYICVWVWVFDWVSHGFQSYVTWLIHSHVTWLIHMWSTAFIETDWVMLWVSFCAYCGYICGCVCVCLKSACVCMFEERLSNLASFVVHV